MQILRHPALVSHLLPFLSWNDCWSLLHVSRQFCSLFDNDDDFRHAVLDTFVPGYAFCRQQSTTDVDPIVVSLAHLNLFCLSQLTPLHVYPTTALTTTNPRSLERLARLSLAHSRFVLLLQSFAHSSTSRPPVEPELDTLPHSHSRQLVFPYPLSSSSSKSPQSSDPRPLRKSRNSNPPPAPSPNPKALKYYSSSWRRSRFTESSESEEYRKSSLSVTTTAPDHPSFHASSPHDLLQATSRLRAPILRVFVPTSDLEHAGEACEDQLVASGLWDHLSTGDIVCNLGYVPGTTTEHTHPSWLVFNGSILVPYTPYFQRLPIEDPISLPSPFYYDHILKDETSINLRLVVEKEQFIAFNASFHSPQQLQQLPSTSSSPTPPKSASTSASASWVSLPDELRPPAALPLGGGPAWSLVNYPHPVRSPTSPGGVAMARKWAWTVRVWRGGAQGGLGTALKSLGENDVEEEAETFTMGIGWEGEWILEAEGTKEGRALLGQCLGLIDPKKQEEEEKLKMEWQVVREKSGGGKVWLRLLNPSLSPQDLAKPEPTESLELQEFGHLPIPMTRKTPRPMTATSTKTSLSASATMAASMSMSISSAATPRPSTSSAPGPRISSSTAPRSRSQSRPSTPLRDTAASAPGSRAATPAPPSSPAAAPPLPGVIRRPSVTRTVGRRPSHSRAHTPVAQNIPVQVHPSLGLEGKVDGSGSLGTDFNNSSPRIPSQVPQAHGQQQQHKLQKPQHPPQAPQIPSPPVSLPPALPPKSPSQKKKLVKGLLHKSSSVKGMGQTSVRAGA